MELGPQGRCRVFCNLGVFDFRPHKKAALGSSTSQSNSCTPPSNDTVRLVAMVVLPVPLFPLAMQITIIGTPVSCEPRTLDIFLKGRGFQSRGGLARHSLGKRSICRDLRQSHHLEHYDHYLVLCLYQFQGLDPLGLFRLLVASYSPLYLVFLFFVFYL